MRHPAKKSRRHGPDAAVPMFQPRGQSLGLAGSDTLKVVRHIREGFAFTTLKKFQAWSDLSMDDIATAVRIPPRTLSRRRTQGRLHPDESERLLRVSGLFEQAVDLFEGDREAARRWMTTPHKALAGQTPLQLLQTEIGGRQLEDLIGRLEHGVFS